MNPIEEKLFAISSEAISVTKDMEGVINGKSYKYASLTSIKEALKKPLKKYELSYRFSVYSTDDKGVILDLYITDGEKFHKTTMFIPNVQMANENQFHTIGSGLTYYKKYMLATEFNLDVQNDIDANTKQIKKKMLKYPSKEFNAVVNLVRNGATKEDISSRYHIPEAVATELNHAIKND